MSDSSSVATARPLGGLSPELSSGPTELTDPHRSKMSPDDPRLKLPQARSRTLKKGPAIVLASGVAVLTGIAVILALNPTAAPAPKDQVGEPETSLAQAFPIPDAIKNAPDNSAPLFAATNPPPAPRLGEPMPGLENPPPGPGGAGYGAGNGVPSPAEQQRIERAEALGKARASGLFFAGDEPSAIGDRPGEPPAPGASQLQQLLASRGADPAAAAGGRPPAGPQDPNLQDRKTDFLDRAGASDASYLQHSVTQPRSPYEVKAGTIIPTVLLTGLNSDLPGEVVGQVRENVFDTVTGNYLLIPQGSRLLAKYDSVVAFGQERVLVCWNRLIRPDGSSINLECMPGVDLAGYAGFADQVDHHWWRILSGVALGSLLAATTQATQGSVSGFQPTLPQLWASGAASSLNQAGQQITQKNLSLQPTIKVRPGFSVNVLVSKDLIIPPFSRGR